MDMVTNAEETLNKIMAYVFHHFGMKMSGGGIPKFDIYNSSLSGELYCLFVDFVPHSNFQILINANLTTYKVISVELFMTYR